LTKGSTLQGGAFSAISTEKAKSGLTATGKEKQILPEALFPLLALTKKSANLLQFIHILFIFSAIRPRLWAQKTSKPFDTKGYSRFRRLKFKPFT